MWSKNNLENKLNYHWSDSYSWWSNDNSETHKLLKWSEYSKNWNEFIEHYSTFQFINQSSLKLYSELTKESSLELFSNTTNTNKILTNQGEGNTNSLFNIKVFIGETDGGYNNFSLLDLNIWHDNDYIYFKWFYHKAGDALSTVDLNIQLSNILFYDVMN